MESSAIVTRLFRPTAMPSTRPTTASGALEVRLRPVAPRRLGGESIGGRVEEETTPVEHEESAPSDAAAVPRLGAAPTAQGPEAPAVPTISPLVKSYEPSPIAERPAALPMTAPPAKPQPPKRPPEAHTEGPSPNKAEVRPPDAPEPAARSNQLQPATSPVRPAAQTEIEAPPDSARPPAELLAKEPTPRKIEPSPPREIDRAQPVEPASPPPPRAGESPAAPASPPGELEPEAVRSSEQPESEPSEVPLRVERIERILHDERPSETFAESAPEHQPSPERKPPLEVEARPAAIERADRSRSAEPAAPQPGTAAGGVTVSIGRIEIIARRPAAPRSRPTRSRPHRIDPGAAFRRKE